MTYVVAVEGISALRDYETLPANVVKAAYRAVNYAAGKEQTRARRQASEELNLPYSYFAGSDSSGLARLGVTARANAETLQAEITGRHKATSLARYVTSGSPASGSTPATPVKVTVARGRVQSSKRMFLLRLRGAANTETTGNLGLAIRLKPGETVTGKYKQIKVGKGLYLLFGPSVDQAFANIAENNLPLISDDMETEFLRLMKVGLPS